MFDENGRCLRVALVTSRFNRAGGVAESRVTRLARALGEAGHRVTILTDPPDDGSPEEEEITEGVTLRRFLPLLSGGRDALSPGMARHLGRSAGRYDVVHFHGDVGSSAATVARWWKGAFVLTPHLEGTSSATQALATPHQHCRAVGRRLVGRASVVVCSSITERTAFIEQFPEAAARSAVVPPGIDVQRLRAVPQIPGDGRKLVVVADDLTPRTNIDQAILAMVPLQPSHRLEVWGEGPERRSLERLVDRLNLGSSIAFRGLADPAELASAVLSASSLLRLSETEIGAVSILEAAAVGTPVVASAIPAHAEALRQVPGGIELVTPTSISCVTQAIFRSAATHPVPADLPEWSTVGERMAEIYHQVVADPPPLPSPEVREVVRMAGSL